MTSNEEGFLVEGERVEVVEGEGEEGVGGEEGGETAAVEVEEGGDGGGQGGDLWCGEGGEGCHDYISGGLLFHYGIMCQKKRDKSLYCIVVKCVGKSVS